MSSSKAQCATEIRIPTYVCMVEKSPRRVIIHVFSDMNKDLNFFGMKQNLKRLVISPPQSSSHGLHPLPIPAEQLSSQRGKASCSRCGNNIQVLFCFFVFFGGVVSVSLNSARIEEKWGKEILFFFAGRLPT